MVSIEPILEKVDLSVYQYMPDWVIVGCESGMGRRPADNEWFQEIVDLCVMTKTPVFIKQISTTKVEDSLILFPPTLQFRQFPFEVYTKKLKAIKT